MRCTFIVALFAWLFVAAFCFAGEVSWADLGGEVKPAPKPKAMRERAAVKEEAEQAPAPAPAPVQYVQPTYYYYPQQYIPQYTYQPSYYAPQMYEASSVYWGGIGGGYANCVGGT